MYYVSTLRQSGLVALRGPDDQLITLSSNRSNLERIARQLNDARMGA